MTSLRHDAGGPRPERADVHARKEFRHHSRVCAVTGGVIMGLGVIEYALALRWIAGQITTAT